MEKLNPRDGVGAALIKSSGAAEQAGIAGRYLVSCLRVVPEYREEADLLARMIQGAQEQMAEREVARLMGKLKELPREEVWADEIYNVVTTVGKNLALDTVLAGSGYTASVVMGLKGVGSAVAGDTMASHGT
jgi:hypothetical protein